MADRTTKVTLLAQVSGYLNGMDQAAKATRSFADGSKAKLDAQRDAMNKVGTAMIAVGALAAAGVALAVKSFADFDAKMAQVKTLSHATADEMDALTVAALHMGQKIGFSAGEVADAEIELVKAGVSVKDIMGGALQGALQLAAAGQIKVSDATEIATIALTQFNLKGKDVPHVADLLAAGADKALGGVSDLGEALKSGGLVADQFGLSLDETVGTLSAFANAGLLGETAGTDLRQMLLKLASPSAEATATMKSLGISIYDASGKFVGMSNLAGQLADKLGKKSEADRNAAEATIFGARAIAGANVLYKEGAKGIADWTNKVNDTGFAAQQARGKMDNLQGDVKKLGAAFQTDLIETGGTANGVLRGSVQTLTNLISLYESLPGPVKGGVLALGGIVAVVGLVGGTALLAVPKVAAFKNALDDLKWSMKGFSLAGGGVVLAISALVTVLSLMADAQANAKQTASDLAATLDKETGAVTKNTRAYVLDKLQKDGSIDAAKKLGISAKTLVDAYLQMPSAMAKVRDVGKELDDSHSALNKTLKKEGVSADDATVAQLYLIKALDDGGPALKRARQDNKDLADVQGTGAAKTQTAAEAYQSAADQAKSLADQVSNLTDEINKANGVGQDAVTANANYQKALADADDTIKKAQQHVAGYSLGIDENTAAGSANASMLADLAAKSEDAAKKQLDLDGNTAAYQQRLKDGHQAVIDRAIALGATAQQAQNLANKVAAIPTEKELSILVQTADAEVKVAALNAHLNALAVARTAVIHVVTNGDGTSTQGMIARAGGGPVYGPGTSTSDSVLLRASAGEYVINAAAYAKNKALVEAINNGANLSSTRQLTPAPQRYARESRQYASSAVAPSDVAHAQVNVTVPAIETQDPRVYGTIIGREIGRRLAQ